MGTTASTLTTAQQEAAIAKAKADWAKANAIGDKAGMEAAHAAADSARGYATTADGSKPLTTTTPTPAPKVTTTPTATVSTSKTTQTGSVATPVTQAVQTTNSPTQTKTPTPTTTSTSGTAGLATSLVGGKTGQGATTIDPNYNPFASQIKTAGDFNSFANDNLSTIQKIALEQGVDMGTAKAMFEAQVNNTMKNLGGESYGSFAVTDQMKSGYATADKINRDIVAADPYLTKVVQSAQATAAGAPPSGHLLQNPTQAAAPTAAKPPVNIPESVKGDKLGEALVNATSGDIFDPESVFNMVMNMMDGENKLRNPMTYNDALKIATDKLDPLYNNSAGGLVKAWSKNSRQRGVYGQLPTDALVASDLGQLENQRASDKANLAYSLVGQDKADAMNEANLYANERNTKIQTLLSALSAAGAIDDRNYQRYMNALAYQDSKAQQAFNNQQQQFGNDVTLSEITGYFRGNPTLAYQQYLKQMSLTDQELQTRIAENKTQVAQAWARINLDKQSQEYKKQKDAIDREIEMMKALKVDTQNEKAFTAGLSETAHDMALRWMPKDDLGNVVNDPVMFDKFFRDAMNRLTGNTGVYKLGSEKQSGSAQ